MPQRKATRDQAPPTTTEPIEDGLTRDDLIEALGNLLVQSRKVFGDVQAAKGREAYTRAWKQWDRLAVRINSLSEGVDILDGR